MTEHLIGNAKELNDLIPGFDYHSAWDTPEAFSRHVEAMDKKEAWSDAGWDGDMHFTGTKNMDEALLLAAEGWKEGATRVERLRSGILAANPTLPKVIKFSLAGSYPDVPRAISGNPINMRTTDLAKSRRRPVITLLSNMSANCGVDKAAITNRAAVVAAIIDQIEAAGYACEVIATAPTRGSMWRGCSEFKALTSIMVKKSSQPVDLVRLAYGLGHASMFRRLIFADWGIYKPLEDKIGSGLGSSCSFERKPLNEKGIYVLPSAEGNSSKFKTEEIAAKEGLDFIIKSLTAQGCPAFTGTPEEVEAAKKEINKEEVTVEL